MLLFVHSKRPYRLVVRTIGFQSINQGSIPCRATMNTKRNIRLWLLYDFANSIVSITFFLYFAQWIVVEKGVADIWFNVTFTSAAILLLLTVPMSSFLLDKYWKRLTGLRISTGAMGIMYLICIALVITDKPVAALIAFTFALYAYLLTFSFYTPLLNDVSTPATVGKISGLGVAANYSGQILGLLIALPFSTGALNFFGGSPRAETLFPAVIIFLILTLPTLIFFKENDRPKVVINYKNEFKLLWGETKRLLVYPGVGLFILAYFLLNDAVLTASNNFPIFMEQIWGVSDTVKTYILGGILLTSGIGGWLSGIIADKFGHKRTMVVISAGWIIILPIIAYAPTFTLFVTATTLMGFWFGANWAVSRSVMSYLAPPQKHNMAFGYFGLVERASSFVGPLVWGGVLTAFVGYGIERYRFAVLAVTGFAVLGLWVMTRVRSDRAKI